MMLKNILQQMGETMQINWLFLTATMLLPAAGAVAQTPPGQTQNFSDFLYHGPTDPIDFSTRDKAPAPTQQQPSAPPATQSPAQSSSPAPTNPSSASSGSGQSAQSTGASGTATGTNFLQNGVNDPDMPSTEDLMTEFILSQMVDKVLSAIATKFGGPLAETVMDGAGRPNPIVEIAMKFLEKDNAENFAKTVEAIKEGEQVGLPYANPRNRHALQEVMEQTDYTDKRKGR